MSVDIMVTETDVSLPVKLPKRFLPDTRVCESVWERQAPVERMRSADDRPEGEGKSGPRRTCWVFADVVRTRPVSEPMMKFMRGIVLASFMTGGLYLSPDELKLLCLCKSLLASP